MSAGRISRVLTCVLAVGCGTAAGGVGCGARTDALLEELGDAADDSPSDSGSSSSSGGSGSTSGSSGSGGSSTSSGGSSSSGGGSGSSSGGSSSSSGSSSGGMVCGSCTTDLQCQLACPPVFGGGTNCCDTSAQVCYATVLTACPGPFDASTE